MTPTAPKSPLVPKGAAAMSAPPTPTMPTPPPLLLTIRFSASLPDLELDIPRPSATTVVSLKHLIRSRLDKAHARRRLRFIHGGKILPDTAVLSSVLRALPPPPPPPPAPTSRGADHAHPAERRGGRDRDRDKDADSSTSKSKGKSIPGRPEPAPRIYVNCSIGDELSPAELESEAQAAALPPPTSSSHLLPSPRHPKPPGLAVAGPGLGLGLTTSTTTPAPRGFDRLLSAGFTASEVNQLRLQFRSIHSSRYTPDTLPSPDSFRRMEDAWIDDNGAAVPAGAGGNSSGAGGADGMLGVIGGGGGGGGTDSDEVGLVGMIDVLIRGVITGFIWPLGSAGWLIREEGMSSDRWRFMVGTGVMLGVLIGFIRAISGDK
ncbi:DUF2407 C-terminal domain-containing protein [Xylaria cf. heliscus]|nr:DUF2407 C-terminal domain-containing protein [Xylaria cf. heliscus]